MNPFARAVEALTLEPIFGPKAWGADSTCRDVHPNGPIPKGHRSCCMANHCTGIEGHPALRETASGRLRLQNWKPEDEKGDQWSGRSSGGAEPTRYVGSAPAEPPKTRKQKRAEKYQQSDETYRLRARLAEMANAISAPAQT